MAKRPWHKTREVLKLQKQWYKKLKDEGFKDVEGGVEGHLMSGAATTVSLDYWANLSNQQQGIKGDKVFRRFDAVADDEVDAINYSEGGKARYYHHASLIAAQAFREGRISPERCYAWLFHSQGDGERVIADHLEVSRAKIRKHIAVLRENIHIRLDNEYR